MLMTNRRMASQFQCGPVSKKQDFGSYGEVPIIGFIYLGMIHTCFSTYEIHPPVAHLHCSQEDLSSVRLKEYILRICRFISKRRNKAAKSRQGHVPHHGGTLTGQPTLWDVCLLPHPRFPNERLSQCLDVFTLSSFMITGAFFCKNNNTLSPSTKLITWHSPLSMSVVYLTQRWEWEFWERGWKGIEKEMFGRWGTPYPIVIMLTVGVWVIRGNSHWLPTTMRCCVRL